MTETTETLNSNNENRSDANVDLQPVGMPDGERERLVMLAEEAGEIVQAVGKALRHGYESKHPNGGPVNRELLRKEIADLLGVFKMMTENGDMVGIFAYEVEIARIRKYKYAHYQ